MPFNTKRGRSGEGFIMAADTNSRTTLRFGVRGDAHDRGGGEAEPAMRSLAEDEEEMSGTTRLEVLRNIIQRGIDLFFFFSKVADE